MYILQNGILRSVTEIWSMTVALRVPIFWKIISIWSIVWKECLILQVSVFHLLLTNLYRQTAALLYHSTPTPGHFPQNKTFLPHDRSNRYNFSEYVGKGSHYLVTKDGHGNYGIVFHNCRKLGYNYYYVEEDCLNRTIFIIDSVYFDSVYNKILL